MKADAGVPDAGEEKHGDADPPILNPGDDAPMFASASYLISAAELNFWLAQDAVSRPRTARILLPARGGISKDTNH